LIRFSSITCESVPVVVSICGGAAEIPPHQFPLGASISLERRLALLSWAQEASAFILEDGYDSEYR
jgi:hypothetical protein